MKINTELMSVVQTYLVDQRLGARDLVGACAQKALAHANGAVPGKSFTAADLVAVREHLLAANEDVAESVAQGTRPLRAATSTQGMAPGYGGASSVGSPALNRFNVTAPPATRQTSSSESPVHAMHGAQDEPRSWPPQGCVELPKESRSHLPEAREACLARFKREPEPSKKGPLLFHWTTPARARDLRESGIAVRDAEGENEARAASRLFVFYGPGLYVDDALDAWAHLPGLDDIVVFRHDGKLQTTCVHDLDFDEALVLGIDAYEDDTKLVLKNQAHVQLLSKAETAKVLTAELRRVLEDLNEDNFEMRSAYKLIQLATRYLPDAELAPLLLRVAAAVPPAEDAVAAALARSKDAAAIRWRDDNGFNGPIAKLWHALTGHR